MLINCKCLSANHTKLDDDFTDFDLDLNIINVNNVFTDNLYSSIYWSWTYIK